jgi:phosphoglycerate dehydrogenase-like enzyme
MALMLVLYRRMSYADRSMRAGAWTQHEFYRSGNYELAGKTLGMIGLGNVGRSIVPKARGFGMNLIYHDVRRLAPNDEAVLGLTYAGLADLLRQADVVSLQVPLTPATRGLIGDKELLLMKPSAILISTCRGGVVDEAPLMEALLHGRLAGAGLDVFSTEPLPADSPWRKLENVILTPHVAGASQEAVRRTFRMAFANVALVADRQEPLNRVA